ncbi:uncharacterized protein LOC120290634 [Eucalyptus grandis]|uniref:uncharacterized protein LOC120290634 n=1 Tax=Eucalyptus grandis TaxID=71139 RepID=UPI00192E914B|nr:uncharacterized protein LOC120290634 [Eucalyptus grandis]
MEEPPLPTEGEGSQPGTAASGPEKDPAIFSARTVSIDYYMARPIPGVDVCYSSFQGEKVNEVPVIRVYGSTPAGQKTFLHVHKALPYLYVPCTDIPIHPTSEGDAFTNAVSLAMEKALKGGAVFDRSLQPHESHIPYLLQFLVDYNLFGMGLLHIMRIRFQHPIPDIFAPKICSDNDQGRQVMAKPYCMFAAFKSYLSSLIWRMPYKTVFLFMLHIVYGFHGIQVDSGRDAHLERLLFGYHLRSQEVGGGSLWFCPRNCSPSSSLRLMSEIVRGDDALDDGLDGGWREAGVVTATVTGQWHDLGDPRESHRRDL